MTKNHNDAGEADFQISKYHSTLESVSVLIMYRCSAFTHMCTEKHHTARENKQINERYLLLMFMLFIMLELPALETFSNPHT